MASTRADILARRALRDQAAIERKGVLAARRLTATIRAKTLAAMRARRVGIDLTGLLQDTLLPLLRDAMLASHFHGIKRVTMTLKEEPKRIVAGVFDNVLKDLEKQQGTNFEELRGRYDGEARTILKGVSDQIHRELRATISDSIRTGAHMKEGVKALSDRFDALGLSPQKDYRLETIFRAQTSLAYNAGKYEAEQDPAIQEILWGYEYSARMDNTRPTHAAMDGVILPKDDPIWKVWRPPNGWNCHCQLLEIYEEEKIKRPPKFASDNSPIVPDKGFAFNPGQVFASNPQPIVPVVEPKRAVETKPEPKQVENPAAIEPVKPAKPLTPEEPKTKLESYKATVEPNQKVQVLSPAPTNLPQGQMNMVEKQSLPKAIGQQGKTVYRGLRTSSLTDGKWSWWTPDKEYAKSYGSNIAKGKISKTAKILDVRKSVVNGEISGKSLDALLPGLAKAMGLDDDESVDQNQLWDVGAFSESKVAKLLEEAGFDGFKWKENENNLAYFLIH